jgi:hypothetical protein
LEQLVQLVLLQQFLAQQVQLAQREQQEQMDNLPTIMII